MCFRWPRLLSYITLLFAFVTSAQAQVQPLQMNMPVGVTTVSSKIYNLHMTILWICIAIGVVVYGLMIYAIFWHRKARGYKAANFHESTTVEVIWTAIPFAILIAMAIPATLTLIEIDDTKHADLTIKVTGLQWFWQYDYLDEDISFSSFIATPEDQIKNLAPKSSDYLLTVDKPLVVPVGKKIRFLVTAKDVIHSWWVPDLGVKRDAIPGFINETWTLIKADKPGTYRGQCAELCGKNHGFMPIVVEAKTESDYQQWVAEQKANQEKDLADKDKVWAKEDLMVRGEKEYNMVCAMCHQANGKGLPPTFPSLVGSDIVTKPEGLVEHIRQILYGKNAMPAFGEIKSDLDIAALVTFERNSWGNTTGDVIQPSDVKKIREEFKS